MPFELTNRKNIICLLPNRSTQSTVIAPQRQVSVGATVQQQQPQQATVSAVSSVSNPSHPAKFVIVKPGINIQPPIKPNIVVMNPPGITQVSSITKNSIKCNSSNLDFYCTNLNIIVSHFDYRQLHRNSLAVMTSQVRAHLSFKKPLKLMIYRIWNRFG